MPLTASGNKVLKHLEEEYKDKKKAEHVFYGMINEGKKGSEKWHKTAKKKIKHNKY